MRRDIEFDRSSGISSRSASRSGMAMPRLHRARLRVDAGPPGRAPRSVDARSGKRLLAAGHRLLTTSHRRKAQCTVDVCAAQ